MYWEEYQVTSFEPTSPIDEENMTDATTLTLNVEPAPGTSLATPVGQVIARIGVPNNGGDGEGMEIPLMQLANVNLSMLSFKSLHDHLHNASNGVCTVKYLASPNSTTNPVLEYITQFSSEL